MGAAVVIEIFIPNLVSASIVSQSSVQQNRKFYSILIAQKKLRVVVKLKNLDSFGKLKRYKT